MPFNPQTAVKNIAWTSYRLAEHGGGGCPEAKSAPVLQDHVRGLFGDHDDRRVGIAGHQVWHDRAVDHAQPLDAANFQALIDYRERVAAHPAGRCRMIDGAATPAAVRQQILVADDLGAGIVLIDHEWLEGRRAPDLPQDLPPLDIWRTPGF